MSHRERTKRKRRYRHPVTLLSTLLSLTTVASHPGYGGDGVRRLPRVQKQMHASQGTRQAIEPTAQQIPVEWSATRTLSVQAREVAYSDGYSAPPIRNQGREESKPIELAARRLAELRSIPDPAPANTSWLPSVTTDSCNERAFAHLDQAYREYTYKAYASAESSAWKTLELLSTGIDVADRRTAASVHQLSMARDVMAARGAITEAQDFVEQGAAIMERDRLVAIATSHQTPVFHAGINRGVTPTEAVDRYLDYARQKLAPLAGYRVEAAQAMDLIAAIRLGRGDATLLPEEVALCLRRAALAGQPSNASLAARLGAQLADMGLNREAEATLRHVESLKPSAAVSEAVSRLAERRMIQETGQDLAASLRQQMPVSPSTPRVPDVIQLTPEQFASISPREYVAGSRPPATDFSQDPPLPPPSRTEPPSRTIEGTTLDRSMNASTNIAASVPPKPTKRSLFAKFAGFRLPKTRVPDQPAPTLIGPGETAGASVPSEAGSRPEAVFEANASQSSQPRQTRPAPASTQTLAENAGPNAVFDDVYPADAYQSAPPKQPSMLRRVFGKIPGPW
ncbi:MAG: hypothetical protein AAF802_13030 [Planctomycetota bacterium]